MDFAPERGLNHKNVESQHRARVGASKSYRTGLGRLHARPGCIEDTRMKHDAK